METHDSLTCLVRLTPEGQLTIPARFQRALGIDEDTMLRMSLSDGVLRITPVPTQNRETGSPWLRELYDSFATVRDEIAASGASEDELNADIDAAVTAVRSQRDSE